MWYLFIYIGLFLISAWRYRQVAWLLSVAVVWIVSWVTLNTVLPEEWSQLISFEWLYFDIILTGCWFVGKRLKRKPGQWQVIGLGTYLPLLVVSGVIQVVVYLLFISLTMIYYPHGITLYILPFFVPYLLLYPIFWIGYQWWLMLILASYRFINHEPPSQFSGTQIGLVFFLMLWIQMVCMITL